MPDGEEEGVGRTKRRRKRQERIFCNVENAPFPASEFTMVGDVLVHRETKDRPSHPIDGKIAPVHQIAKYMS